MQLKNNLVERINIVSPPDRVPTQVSGRSNFLGAELLTIPIPERSEANTSQAVSDFFGDMY